MSNESIAPVVSPAEPPSVQSSAPSAAELAAEARSQGRALVAQGMGLPSDPSAETPAPDPAPETPPAPPRAPEAPPPRRSDNPFAQARVARREYEARTAQLSAREQQIQAQESELAELRAVAAQLRTDPNAALAALAQRSGTAPRELIESLAKRALPGGAQAEDAAREAQDAKRQVEELRTRLADAERQRYVQDALQHRDTVAERISKASSVPQDAERFPFLAALPADAVRTRAAQIVHQVLDHDASWRATPEDMVRIARKIDSEARAYYDSDRARSLYRGPLASQQSHSPVASATAQGTGVPTNPATAARRDIATAGNGASRAPLDRQGAVDAGRDLLRRAITPH